MKKIISIILIACMCCSLFAACATSPKESSAPAPESNAPVEENKESEKSKLDYPTRPITLQIAWAAGGATDLVGRTMAALSEKYFGVPMNVVNREGANATIAFTEMMTTAPDGYTISVGVTGNFVTMPYTQKLEYSFEQTTPIIGLMQEPLAIIVLEDSPIQSIEDIKNMDKALYGMSGSRGGTHLSVETLIKSAGLTNLEFVPFQGGGAQLAPALLGKQVDLIIAQPQTARVQIESGEARIIAFLTDERCADYPDVPTVAELGYEGVMDGSIKKWLFAPAGLDPEIQQFLYEGFEKMKEDPLFIEALANNKCYDWDADYNEVTDTIKTLKEQTEPLVNELGWAAQ